MDHRRARGERTRNALIAASLDLFSEHGYHTTTIDEIVGRAHVSQRTFFHHFPTKEHVLFDGYVDRLDLATVAFRTTPPDAHLWWAVKRACLAVVAAIEEEPSAFLQRARLYSGVDALRELMLFINEDWIDRMTTEVGQRLGRDPDTHVAPRLVAMLANSANRTALDLWARSDSDLSLRKLVTQSLDFIRPAITSLQESAGPAPDFHRHAI